MVIIFSAAACSSPLVPIEPEAGRQTPTGIFESYYTAYAAGDYDVMLSCISPDEQCYAAECIQELRTYVALAEDVERQIAQAHGKQIARRWRASLPLDRWRSLLLKANGSEIDSSCYEAVPLKSSSASAFHVKGGFINYGGPSAAKCDHLEHWYLTGWADTRRRSDLLKRIIRGEQERIRGERLLLCLGKWVPPSDDGQGE